MLKLLIGSIIGRIWVPCHATNKFVKLGVTHMWQQSSGQLTRYFRSMLALKESRTIIYIDEFYHRTIQLASITATTKCFKSVLSPEAFSIHQAFYDLDKDQIILEDNTHETCSILQLQTFTKKMARCTSLHLPIWLSMRSQFYHTSAIVQAGHNKWSKVKHKKKITDLEKSTTIHKYVKLIASAIKVGGGPDPNSNIRLAGIIESARKSGM